MPSSAPAPMPNMSMSASAPHCTRSRRSALNVALPLLAVTGRDLLLIPSLSQHTSSVSKSRLLLQPSTPIFSTPGDDLQEVLGDITTKHAGLKIGIIRQLDVEAALQVDLFGKAEDQIDVEDNTHAQAGEAQADGRVGREQVHGVRGTRADIDAEVDVCFNAREGELHRRVDDIVVGQARRDGALGVAVHTRHGE